MFDEKLILERLRKGEDINDIADDLSKALNAAKTLHDKEQEEAKKKNELEETKINDFTAIMEDLKNFFIKYYADGNEDFINSIDAAIGPEVVKDTLAQLDSVFGIFLKIENKISPSVKTINISKNKHNADDVITNFLKSMGL